MVASQATRSRDAFGRHAHTILALQGGGALGAYQAGVYEGLADAGFLPDWVAGVSIGAVNAALIAGNAPENRIARLRGFWERVSSGIPLVAPAAIDPFRLAFNRFSAMATATFGVPGFFAPRIPPPWLYPDGMPEALSMYDTSPLEATLNELVDFDLINQRKLRLSVGATQVRTGNSHYFDNYADDPRVEIRAEHVMASGALPPGFPAITIDGEPYWDGGVVSNTPLWYVLDDSPRLNALIFQVDLFSARGSLPRNLDEVLERDKDIQYSSKTRLNTTRIAEFEEFRDLMHDFMARLPAKYRNDPGYLRLNELCTPAKMSIVHLINRRSPASTNSKDYEFSRGTVETLWQAGLEDVRRSIAHPSFRRAQKLEPGVRIFDLAR